MRDSIIIHRYFLRHLGNNTLYENKLIEYAYNLTYCMQYIAYCIYVLNYN